MIAHSIEVHWIAGKNHFVNHLRNRIDMGSFFCSEIPNFGPNIFNAIMHESVAINLFFNELDYI